MAQLILNLPSFDLHSYWIQGLDSNNMPSLISGPTKDIHQFYVQTSKLPANSIIDSVYLSTKSYYYGSATEYGFTSGSTSLAYVRNPNVDGATFTTLNNATIKSAIESGKQKNGSYSNIQFSYNLTGSGKISSSVFTTVRYDLYRRVENIVLTINYSDPIRYDLDSPSLNNFSLLDTWSNKTKATLSESIAGEGAGEPTGFVKLVELEDNYPLVAQDFSNLRFTLFGQQDSSQPTGTPTYSLNITHDAITTSGENYTQEIYSSVNSTGTFEVGKEYFSGELDCFPARDVTDSEGIVHSLAATSTVFKEELYDEEGNLIDGDTCFYVKYNYKIICYDSAEKGTGLQGVFYLIKDYQEPTFLSPLTVERFSYLIQQDETYLATPSSDGENVITNFSAMVSETPKEIVAIENQLYYRATELLYKKEVINENEQGSAQNEENFTGAGSNTLTLSGNTRFTFFNGQPYSTSETNYELVNEPVVFQMNYSSNNAYTFTVTISDGLFEKSSSYSIEEASGYLSIELGGVAVGMRHPATSEEDSENKTFLVNMPSSFYQTIFLQQEITYGRASPDTIFIDNDGNSTAKEGQIYFKII